MTIHAGAKHRQSGRRRARLVSRRSTRPERWLLRKLLAALGDPPLCFELWDGGTVVPREREPRVTVVLKDRATLFRLALNPELEFGAAYADSRIEVRGALIELLEMVIAARTEHASEGWLRRARSRLLNRPRPNSPAGSRRNIHHHYDLGNEFYRLWLDQQMLYTCAYFPSEDMTLEQAQTAKMEHVCRKLELRPGQTVVEAGCGWGSLALFMARERGVTVKAFNISREQIDFAQAWAEREGLAGQVEFIKDDYRNLSGRFDAFVSVGMLEHVGPSHYRELGGVVDRCLKKNGRGFLHTIGRNRLWPLNPWIERRVFPGAHPPTLTEMMTIFEPNGFSVLDIENLRLHYAQTLEHWLARYERSEEEIGRMFDDAFVRSWRLYLAGSLAAFRAGSLQLFQVLFARGSCNDVPRSRAHLYASDEGSRDAKL